LQRLPPHEVQANFKFQSGFVRAGSFLFRSRLCMITGSNLPCGICGMKEGGGHSGLIEVSKWRGGRDLGAFQLQISLLAPSLTGLYVYVRCHSFNSHAAAQEPGLKGSRRKPCQHQRGRPYRADSAWRRKQKAEDRSNCVDVSIALPQDTGSDRLGQLG
jgi:hypothetical protein